MKGSTPVDEKQIAALIAETEREEATRRATETPPETSRRHLETATTAIIAANPDPITLSELLGYVNTTEAATPPEDRPLPIQGLRAKMDKAIGEAFKAEALALQEHSFRDLFLSSARYHRDEPIRFTPDPHNRPPPAPQPEHPFKTAEVAYRTGYVWYDEVRDVDVEELARAGVRTVGEPRYDARVGREVIEVEFTGGVGEDDA